jgi:hypothetical protein
VADDPERFAVALASENLNGEQVQLQALAHRTSDRRSRMSVSAV